VGPHTGREYASVSGDRNPIHTFRLAAWLFGYRRPIAHGLWSAARCLAALEDQLPDHYRVDVAFRRPIPLPTSVAFSTTPADGGCTFALHDPHSAVAHLTGRITSTAPRHPGVS
jgi:acyl dehydratase